MREIRQGLKGLLRKVDRLAIMRAEAAVVLLVRNSTIKRSGDPAGTLRLADLRTLRTHDRYGLVVEVRGYVNGTEDPGLHCIGCPLSDIVEAGGSHD